MSQADSTNTTGVPGVGGEGLYLPTDVTPEQIFQEIGKLRKEARDEIDRLIGFLDKTDSYMFRELEDSIDDNPHDEETDDNGEDNEFDDPAEPSLGAFEGHDDQNVAWKAGRGSTDVELDDAEQSGIGDQDGLDEQVPFRDWQMTGMV